jgi:hypothetical protein
MEEVHDAGFEDYSVSNTLEKLAFSIEQAVSKWLVAFSKGEPLPGSSSSAGTRPSLHTAVEGMRTNTRVLPAHKIAAARAAQLCTAWFWSFATEHCSRWA